MADTIGRISVPTTTASGKTFPLVSDFGYGLSQDYPIIVHRFGELATKAEQRFQAGIGPRKFPFKRAVLSRSDRAQLFDFYESVQGSFQSFLYNAPKADSSTEAVSVIFDTQPLSIEDMATWCKTGFSFVEAFDPSSAPSYPVTSTCLRFPSDALKTALLDQVQQIIPLVHIKVREAGVNEIYLSDRRCTVGGQSYLPRLIGLGDRGSEVIISQDIKGTADNVQFTFGNADRVMTQLANDTDLKFASIDLSLYHVNSGILLQLWKGFVISFVSDGSPQFTMQCSDGLYQVTNQYPNRVISRRCWKTFNDGVNCPYATKGSGGDPTSCDYFFDSANGCHAHGMDTYFGGHAAQPQGVLLKDNSTGVFGFGRNTVTATSIVSDTMWGQALPEIWCNDGGDPTKAFVVNAIMADGRDEGDFFDGLGIVGAGPLGDYAGMQVAQNSDGYRYILAPTLDGFPPQGFKVDSQLNVKSDTNLGLREIRGLDPASGETDDSGNPEDTSFALGQGTPQVWKVQTQLGLMEVYAAGTAFVELRYPKPSGFDPTLVEQHQMQVPISKGLGGRVWDSSGSASWVDGLTNPFWVGINSYLRAIGLPPRQDDDGTAIAAQLATFALPSLNAGDGSGTAEIADNVVTPLVGTGTETQFQFQGTVAQLKPFRDWLTEILAVGLGGYVWEFGKLKFFIRENASAVSAFTLGNILYQSLHLEPIEASFEKLTIEFADQAYQYQTNTGEYEDKDHAAYYGRQNASLAVKQHSVGCPTLSQALRMATVRTREEVGGINADEWKAARRGGWKTTILALETEAGQVVSLTHPEAPGGFAHFRIQRWRLMKDWSIEIDVQSVTASMYDVEIGPKPADVSPQPLPALFYPEPLGEWAPFEITADPSDALFPGEYTFDLAQSYQFNADNSVAATAVVKGKLPVNQFIPGCGAPLITKGSVSVATTGGFIQGGVTLRIAICAVDGNGKYSPPSDIILVQIPSGSSANLVTISDIVWQPFPGLVQAVVFASTADDTICARTTVAFGAGSVTLTGPIEGQTWGIPNPNVREVRIKAKDLLHGGVIGVPIDKITGNRTFVANQSVDLTGTDNWAGRVIQLIGRDNDSCPFSAFNCTAFNASTGQFTVDRDLTGILEGDVVVVCTLGVDNSANPLIISDPGLSNAGNYDLASGRPTPFSGLTVNLEVGAILRVVKGKSRGQWAKIVSNGATSYTLDRPISIDATSVWQVEAGTWKFAVSVPVNNAGSQNVTAITVPTTNYLRQSLWIGAFTVDVNGDESEDGDGPGRPLYLFGAGPDVVVLTSDTLLTEFDQQINLDSTAGRFIVTLPFARQVIGRRVLFKKISADSNTITIQTRFKQDGTQETIDGATQWIITDPGDALELAGNFAG